LHPAQDWFLVYSNFEIPGETMRSEKEMYDLILNVARSDERVRAVILDGSRANPDTPRDPFQDYDVMYLVTDVECYKLTPHWIDVFGERMILQLPDDMGSAPPEPRDGYAYLMQFADGNRIDLTLFPADKAAQIKRDSMRKVLMDKDNIIDENAISDAKAYLPHPPTAKEFADACNEFWWVCPYCAKGLWRGELPYAHHMMDVYVREQLEKMLAWYTGMQSGFNRSAGKFSKYLQKNLSPEMWAQYLHTYAGSDCEEIWKALFAMCGLFREAALPIAERFNLTYPADDERRVFAYLERIHNLPKDAREIY
jgi:aminoglycoside 6-adenylyltransferase